MNYFIKNIHINKLFHLKNFDIKIKDEKSPHLIITGKNGSGKTILLNAISDFLDIVKKDRMLNIFTYKQQIDFLQEQLKDNDNNLSPQQLSQTEGLLEIYQKQKNQVFGKVELDFQDIASLVKNYEYGNFIIAFYQAERKPQMIEPINPTKPTYSIKVDAKQTATSQFLNFLSDLKIQEALARNENMIEDADKIGTWFIDFENLLQEIYEDNDLKLKFNYKDYSFKIQTEEKEFKFTELSDGYAAILDIVVDLILKMQSKDNLTRAYHKEGIVLIDEVETHLHLELQKKIMPFLTKVFPNIQFIITTHSPFVLSSLDNAVAFDLEHREEIDELTQYSYSALAEGYFGVSSDSSYMQMQLSKLEEILKKEDLSEQEIAEVKYIMADFEKIPESVSPNLVGLYISIKNKYASVIKKLPL